MHVIVFFFVFALCGNIIIMKIIIIIVIVVVAAQSLYQNTSKMEKFVMFFKGLLSPKSGKTPTLQALQTKKQQTIDLEAVALIKSKVFRRIPYIRHFSQTLL